MFALPNSKRVRRNELDSPSSSRASTPDPDILARLRATTQFDLIEAVQTGGPFTNQPADEEDDDVELAFNLFAPPTTTTTTSTDNNASTSTAPQTEQKIRLRSPTPLSEQNPGFTVTNRPDQTYYFTGSLSPTKAAEYNAAAVEGSTILQEWSKRPCPGCAYPWKVISVPATAVSKALVASRTPAEDKFLPDEEEEEEKEKEKKRRRLGKNARIKKRVKAEKARLRKEEAEKGKEEKEKAEREKRARRNREKKFKKRARDKAKKAAGGAAGAEGEDGEGSGNGSGSEGEGDE